MWRVVHVAHSREHVLIEVKAGGDGDSQGMNARWTLQDGYDHAAAAFLQAYANVVPDDRAALLRALDLDLRQALRVELAR